MGQLTDRQRAFLVSQGISESDVFDATGLSSKDWKKQIREAGLYFAFGTVPCAKAGHTLRERYGHCIECETKYIAFCTRKRTKARVYIAGSLKTQQIKVGLATDIDGRLNNLRFQSYGSADDWQMLAATKPVADAGKIEEAAQAKLDRFRTVGYSDRSGTAQASKEAFCCTYLQARSAVVDNLPPNLELRELVGSVLIERFNWKSAA